MTCESKTSHAGFHVFTNNKNRNILGAKCGNDGRNHFYFELVNVFIYFILFFFSVGYSASFVEKATDTCCERLFYVSAENTQGILCVWIGYF